MSIQKWGYSSFGVRLQTLENGNFVLYSDHLAAMKEQEERVMRFTEWFSDISRGGGSWYYFDGEKTYKFTTIKEAFQYWKENVDTKH